MEYLNEKYPSLTANCNDKWWEPHSDKMLCLMGAVFLSNKDIFKNPIYDITWSTNVEHLTNNVCVIDGYNSHDAFFNFIVHNATYAKIYYNGECIDMIKNNDDNFVIPYAQIGSTCTNPMFSHFYYNIEIRTDGNKVSYCDALIDRRKCYPQKLMDDNLIKNVNF